MSTRGWQKKHDAIESAIMDGYRRGVCNKDGNSVRVNGVYVGVSRKLGSTAKTLCNNCRRWYRRGEYCGC